MNKLSPGYHGIVVKRPPQGDKAVKCWIIIDTAAAIVIVSLEFVQNYIDYHPLYFVMDVDSLIIYNTRSRVRILCS